MGRYKPLPRREDRYRGLYPPPEAKAKAEAQQEIAAELAPSRRSSHRPSSSTGWWKNPFRSTPPPFSSPAESILAKDLVKRFGGRRALQNLQLSIAAGEIFALVGRNGSGKTVTIRLLAGLLQPTSGQILLMGQSFSAWQRPPVGVMLEAPTIFPELTALEHLKKFSSRFQNRIPDEALQVLLEKVGLDPAHLQPVRTFSLGMQRRLNLAQALLHDPPILLLDEPLAALDTVSRKIVVEILREQALEGKAILWATAESKTCKSFCHRMGILESGRLRAEGSPVDVLRSTRWQQPLQVDITTEPMDPAHFHALQTRLPVGVAMHLTERGDHLSASVANEQKIPVLLAALQAEAIPVYGIETIDAFEGDY